LHSNNTNIDVTDWFKAITHKIDKLGLLGDKITTELIQFCKAMELEVVVEYIENKKTFELLKSLNVDYFQGYYFHKPELLN
tara:strand:- start:136 stop:378 length:243 start_codon:yes stop_codon:yes gene_type:complete